MALLVGLCHAQEASSPEAWELRLDQSSIQIYTRPMPNNPIDEYKGVTQIPGNIDSAFAVISNISRFLKADPFIERTEVQQKGDSNVFYVWAEMKMPFFMKNRDMVSRIHTSKTSKGYFVMIESQPEAMVEREGYVRIQQAGSIISLQQGENGVFELNYKGYLYPTSDFTANYANKALVTSTYERLASLRKLLVDELADATGK